jgi:actin-like ATPase involved in cell morphogenesis
MTEIGAKVGSLHTAIAYRAESNNEIKTDCKHTCIRYPKDFVHGHMKPIVGEKAFGFDDTISPLNLGIIEDEAGIQHTIDILNAFDMAKDATLIVLASPAMEIAEGKKRIVTAIDTVASPKNIRECSEGLCSAIYILGNTNILSETFFTLNLGSSTTEFGCVSEGDIIHLSAHGEVSGNKVDDAIESKIRNSVSGAMFVPSEICNMKENTSLKSPKEFTIRGTSRKGFTEVTISDEVISSINEYSDVVVDFLQNEILNSNKITPRIRKKAIEMPLIISGGMSNIEGLPELIIRKLNEKINFNFKAKYTKLGDGHIAPAIGALMLAEEITKEERK